MAASQKVALTDAPRRSLIATREGKQIRILHVDTWKRILRLIRETKAEGFEARFHCPSCDQRITLTVPHPTSPHFSCRCTEWMGR